MTEARFKRLRYLDANRVSLTQGTAKRRDDGGREVDDWDEPIRLDSTRPPLFDVPTWRKMQEPIKEIERSHATQVPVKGGYLRRG